MSADLVKKRDTTGNVIVRIAAFATGATVATLVQDVIVKVDLLEKAFNRAFELQMDIETVTCQRVCMFNKLK